MTIKTRIVEAYYHEWIESRGRSVCRLCGVDLRHDGTDQPPCKAPVVGQFEIRPHTSPIADVTKKHCDIGTLLPMMYVG